MNKRKLFSGQTFTDTVFRMLTVHQSCRSCFRRDAYYYGHSNPGIKIRANQRSFQYMSTIISQVLDREIVRLRLPDIHQKVEEVCSVLNYRLTKSI